MHHVGQRAQHTTDWAIPAPQLWGLSCAKETEANLVYCGCPASHSNDNINSYFYQGKRSKVELRKLRRTHKIGTKATQTELAVTSYLVDDPEWVKSYFTNRPAQSPTGKAQVEPGLTALWVDALPLGQRDRLGGLVVKAADPV